MAQTFLDQLPLETEQNKRKKDKLRQTCAQLWCIAFCFYTKIFFQIFSWCFFMYSTSQKKKKNFSRELVLMFVYKFCSLFFSLLVHNQPIESTQHSCFFQHFCEFWLDEYTQKKLLFVKKSDLHQINKFWSLKVVHKSCQKSVDFRDIPKIFFFFLNKQNKMKKLVLGIFEQKFL